MRKFKIDDNKKPIDKKSAETHKDFDRLVTNYQQVLDSVHKQPLYKSKKGFLLILLVILVLTAIVISQNEKDESDRKNDQQEVVN